MENVINAPLLFPRHPRCDFHKNFTFIDTLT